MKFYLYIERRIGEFPHEEIFPLKAETPFNALLEADRHYDKDVVFILKIYEHVVSSVDGNVQTDLYMPRLEKRCEQWSRYSEEYSKHNAVCCRRAVK